MDITVVLAIMIFLLCLGMPVAFAMGVASAVYLILADIPMAMMVQRATHAVDSFIIMAIPFFYLAGELMNACKLTDRILHLARVCVGHISGGLVQVNIFASMIFAGMSGSATADTAALGSILIPSMKKEGYSGEFAAAITVASAMVGPIIPPSIALVIYGSLADVSIGRLLLAGVIPGITIIAIQMVFCYIIAKRNNFPKYERATLPEFGSALKRGTPAILFPLIIVGGISFGIFTPTEAASVAILYALFLAFVVYRNMTTGKLWETTLSVSWGSIRVLLVIAFASTFSWIMLREQVPQTLAFAIATISSEKLIVLAIMVVFLLLVGLFMLASSAEIVLTPILVPVALQFGIDPVHFGILMVFCLIIGGGTPPVGVLLFVAQDIAQVPFNRMVKAMAPFYIPLFIAIVIIAVFPQISLFLPNLAYGVQ